MTQITSAGENGYTDVTQNAGTTYTVKKLVSGAYVSAQTEDYTLSADGTFTPKLVTNFQITASYGGQEASAVIIVGKGTLTIAAQDTTKAVNDAERAPETASISGAASWDALSLSGATDYTLTTEGMAATVPGNYPITVALKSSSDAIKALQQRYNILLKNATYTLTSTSYTVTAAAGSNGSVSITSKTPGSDTDVPIISGSSLPEGSSVTITATPNIGYVVSGWKLNEAYVLDSSSNRVTTPTYTMASLTGNAAVSAEFDLGSNTLSFTSDNINNGTVTGNYFDGSLLGGSFTSGGNVNYNQTIRLSALTKLRCG